VVILLMAIGGLFYWWLLMTIGEYFIVDIGGY
jgi:hypothetical protein